MTFSPTLRNLKIVRQAAAAAILGAMLMAPQSFAGEMNPDHILDVVVDRSRLIRLPDRVATLVIGNPLIADASMQPNGLMVLTGKGYGSTNLIALDRKGNALMEKIVQVHGPQHDVVVVYKGVNRETYSCAPLCNPTATLGDAQKFFSENLAQTATRSSQAAAIGNSQ